MTRAKGGLLLVGLLGVAVVVSRCESVPLTAPAGSSIFLQANPTFRARERRPLPGDGPRGRARGHAGAGRDGGALPHGPRDDRRDGQDRGRHRSRLLRLRRALRERRRSRRCPVGPRPLRRVADAAPTRRRLRRDVARQRPRPARSRRAPARPRASSRRELAPPRRRRRRSRSRSARRFRTRSSSAPTRSGSPARATRRSSPTSSTSNGNPVQNVPVIFKIDSVTVGGAPRRTTTTPTTTPRRADDDDDHATTTTTTLPPASSRSASRAGARPASRTRAGRRSTCSHERPAGGVQKIVTSRPPRRTARPARSTWRSTEAETR